VLTGRASIMTIRIIRRSPCARHSSRPCTERGRVDHLVRSGRDLTLEAHVRSSVTCKWIVRPPPASSAPCCCATLRRAPFGCRGHSAPWRRHARSVCPRPVSGPPWAARCARSHRRPSCWAALPIARASARLIRCRATRPVPFCIQCRASAAGDQAALLGERGIGTMTKKERR
jgi:hypothetical protein